MLRPFSIFAALALFCVGCGSGKTASVSGRVTLNGKPLPKAAVLFNPVATTGNHDPGPGSAGTTDDEGRYRLLGLPKSGQYELRVRPRAGQSYLEMIKWVGDTEGLKPITVDFSLRRGVTVRFRLIDKVTRQPVAALEEALPAI